MPNPRPVLQDASPLWSPARDTKSPRTQLLTVPRRPAGCREQKYARLLQSLSGVRAQLRWNPIAAPAQALHIAAKSYKKLRDTF